jgi:simple sugar transport system substrate-binding protein
MSVRLRLSFAAILAMALGLLALTGCGSSSSSADSATGGSGGSTEINGALTQRGEIHIEVDDVGVAGDPFFVPIKNMMKVAEQDFGVSIGYHETQTFNVEEQARFLEASVATKPDGIIVQMVDKDALGAGVREAEKAGIPVVFMTSGFENLNEFNPLAYVGAIDRETGALGGEEFKKDGVKDPICINHQVGNKPLDERCRGFEEGYGSPVNQLAIEGEDPSASKGRIAATLESEPEIDGLFTLGNTGATPALEAVKQTGKQGQVKIATVDLNKEILQAIDSGEMLFALDQQQGLQAYDAVQALVMYLQFGYTPPEGLVKTGPVTVDKENANKFIPLQEAGWQ